MPWLRPSLSRSVGARDVRRCALRAPETSSGRPSRVQRWSPRALLELLMEPDAPVARLLADRVVARYGRSVVVEPNYLSELLDGQLGFLLAQSHGAAVTAVPGFLRALRSDPRLAIHLDDLHAQAERMGDTLQAEEHDGGNPARLLEIAFEEAGTKVPREQIAGRLAGRMRNFQSLLGQHHHPFVLPFPSTADQAVGRISTMIITVEQLAAATPGPILQLETTGHTRMVAQHEDLQERVRISTRTDPSVALLRLEAVENLLLSEQAYAEPPTQLEHATLRVEVVESAVRVIRAAHKEPPSPALREALGPIVEDVHRAAQLVALDLRRRLYTTRSRLGVLLRFKARCEWHDRERLRVLADEAAKAKRIPEHALRDELTLYLFDQGLNPLSETVLGAVSRADVFDPSVGPAFYVEAKQYGDRSGLESELRSAFRQAADTVGNLPGSGYGIDEAFVVLFRRGGPRAFLPRDAFDADGINWYCVLINIAEASADSSQNRETPVEYTAESLRAMLLEVRGRG
jgi:hypothetical protein